MCAESLLFGVGLGSAGGFERLHFLLETAFDGDELSATFKKVGLLQFDLSANPVSFVATLSPCVMLRGVPARP